MEEGCAQEQKRVALGRGHQDAEAIDAARQALQPSPLSPSVQISLSLYLSLSLSPPETVISDPPLPPALLIMSLFTSGCI